MTWLSTKLQWIDDRLNPIVVKELRQAVKGRFAIILVGTFLLLSLIFLFGIAISSSDTEEMHGSGDEMLLWLQGLVLGTCLLFIPMYLMLRLSAERSDNHTDLMFVTTMPIRAIVWGKWLSGLVLAALVYSACAPFMTLAYLLRGVDLPTIALCIAMGLGLVMLLTMFAVLLAVLTTRLIGRILLLLVLLVAALWALVAAISACVAVIQFGITYDKDFWAVVAVVVSVGISGLGLLYVCAVALLKPPSANRALPVRLYMTVIWALLAGIFFAFAVDYDESDFINVWLILSALLFSAYLVVAVCERGDWGPRVRSTVPCSPLKKGLALLYYSGAPGGVLWALLMSGLSLLLCLLLVPWLGGLALGKEILVLFSGIVIYSLAYSLTAKLLQHYLLGRWFAPHMTWLVGLLLLAACCTLPTIGMWLADPVLASYRNSPMFALNPFMAVNQGWAGNYVSLYVAGVWAALALVASVPMMARQIRRMLA